MVRAVDEKRKAEEPRRTREIVWLALVGEPLEFFDRKFMFSCNQNLKYTNISRSYD